MQSIFGMEPFIAFLYLHFLLLPIILVIGLISRIKSLSPKIKSNLEKTILLILISYGLIHVIHWCMVTLGIFIDDISAMHWLASYFKLIFALGLFIGVMYVLGILLFPFGVFALLISSIKDILE